MKTVAVLGKGELACRICDWFHTDDLHDLRFVVPVIPEPSWTTSITHYCKSVLNGNRTNGIRLLDCYQEVTTDIDIIFSCQFDQILTPYFLQSHSNSLILNLHYGPLPKYAGIRPINFALKNKENTHGVTIHKIESGIDDGKIYSQTLFSIWPDTDEVQDVYNRCECFGWQLFKQTIVNIDTIVPYLQNWSNRLYYSKADIPELGDRANWTRELSRKGKHEDIPGSV